MAKILEMPKLSPTMEEGQVASWSKKEGDEVAIDDVLAEVETDKATMEFRSFDKGTLLKILAPAGTTVKLGQPVAILGDKGEDVSAMVAKAGGGGGETKEPAKKESADADAPDAKAPPEKDDAEKDDAEKDDAKQDDAPEKDDAKKDAPKKSAAAKDAPRKDDASKKPAEDDDTKASEDDAPKSGSATETVPPAATRRGSGAAPKSAAQGEPTEATPAGEGGRVRASPYVRKLAREQDIDLHGMSGTGPHGRIIARDLSGASGQSGSEASGAAPKTVSAAASPGKLRPPESKPLSMMRKTIARRLSESKKNVPHFYLTIDVDAQSVAALREDINRDLAAHAKDKAQPEKISLNDLIVRAVAIALVRVPECNAEFAGDAILYHRRVDLSVAVAVPDGLLTPVVRDADRKSVRAIAREIRELAARAKTKKLTPEEMTNGTFSISNLGMFGIDEFSAVINPPEGAILAIGRLRDEPVVRDGAVVPGQRMSMTLSCDHRVIDGAVGARFLAELRGLLEHPLGILIEG